MLSPSHESAARHQELLDRRDANDFCPTCGDELDPNVEHPCACSNPDPLAHYTNCTCGRCWAKNASYWLHGAYDRLKAIPNVPALTQAARLERVGSVIHELEMEIEP